MYTKSKLLSLLLLIIPYIGYSQCYEYFNNADVNNYEKKVTFNIEQAFATNDSLHITMSFCNNEKDSITLIKPDTSMIESSVLGVYFYYENSKTPIRYYWNTMISQLAHLTVSSHNELFYLAPNDKVFSEIIIPIIHEKNISKITLFIDYDYIIISTMKLHNVIQQVLLSNIADVTRSLSLDGLEIP